jgi:hypothetical protein
MKRRICFGLLAAVAMPLLTGCPNTIGPTALRGGRQDYNTVLHRTNAEQFLLNIVRLRYNEPPMFLEVAAVNTTFQLAQNYGATAGLNDRYVSPMNNTFGLSAGVQFAESPTITYMPMQGEQFVKELLSPVSLNDILLLYQSGWNLEPVLTLTLQNMNRQLNAPTACSPTATEPPEYKGFRRAAFLLGFLQKKNLIDLAEQKTEAGADLILAFREESDKHPETAEFKTLMGLDHAPLQDNMVSITTVVKPGVKILVSTRSVLSSLTFLSKGVCVPPEDVKEGRVVVARQADGETIFDWREVMGGFFEVGCGDAGSSGQAVAVDYRGRRFFIRDTDHASKATFHLLAQLFALEAGSVASAAPVLTVPVGGK